MSVEVAEMWMMNLSIVGFTFIVGVVLSAWLISKDANAGVICGIIWCCIEAGVLILSFISGRQFNIIIHLMLLLFVLYNIITWSTKK